MPSRPATVSHTVPSACPDWAALLAAVPGGAATVEASAQATGVVVRRRQIRAAGDLLRLVLAYAVTGWSLRFTAAWAEVVGVGVLSEAALRRRFRVLQPWLAHLVATCLLDAPRPCDDRAMRVRLLDATAICQPGARSTDWRVHLSLTVAPVPHVDALEVTDAHGGESLRRFACAPGEVVLADRGYCQPAALAEAAASGAALVVRYAWQSCPLRTAAGRPLELAGWLNTLPPGGNAELAVTLARRGAPPLPGLRLVALALPEDVANQARARLRRQAQRKGRTPSAQSLLVAGYVVLLTSLPPDTWAAAAVLRLYRLRWQVELTFKRLKGQWLLGTLRARTPGLSQATLLSRLLGALLADRLAHPRGVPRVAWCAAVDQPLSLWRWGVLWQQVLQQAVTGTLGLAAVVQALPRLQRHLCDHPRRRPQQAAVARALLTALPLRTATVYASAA
jgi:hypothetical protein